MEAQEMNLPKVKAHLFCNRVRQDVMTKNYDLLGTFQGFSPPGYPFGADFMSFTRFFHEGKGEFKIDITVFDEKGEKVSACEPRRISFAEAPSHDLITGWRVAFPRPGTYLFKVFCNNLNLGDYKIFCR